MAPPLIRIKTTESLSSNSRNRLLQQNRHMADVQERHRSVSSRAQSGLTMTGA